MENTLKQNRQLGTAVCIIGYLLVAMPLSVLAAFSISGPLAHIIPFSIGFMWAYLWDKHISKHFNHH